MKKHSSREAGVWEAELSEHQIRGWRAASVSGLQDKGSPNKSVFVHRRRWVFGAPSVSLKGWNSWVHGESTRNLDLESLRVYL